MERLKRHFRVQGWRYLLLLPFTAFYVCVLPGSFSMAIVWTLFFVMQEEVKLPRFARSILGAAMTAFQGWLSVLLRTRGFTATDALYLLATVCFSFLTILAAEIIERRLPDPQEPQQVK